ncbi:MAG: RDD family protein [Ilumatobacter sp.]|uniref:RDD family protein n=1 Tax=Ilumatobacter sp. TaxID=1967498 RepID=UPI0026233F78|nr:RDD family protein [Ilumatobacter sp.]MDJ0769678.1 RDD family protein [Ilumatobacter sp.]
MRYAGWGCRAGAVLIDGLLAIPFLIPTIVVLVVGPTEAETCTIEGEPGLCDVPTAGTIGVAFVLAAVGLLVYLAIYCRRVGRTGQSWGMGAAGYRVVDARTGQPIGTGRSVARWFARVVSALPCYLGFLWPLWDEERRTFHDMIVGTRAVRA